MYLVAQEGDGMTTDVDINALISAARKAFPTHRTVAALCNALEESQKYSKGMEPTISSPDTDPMRTNFTCNLHQTNYGLTLYLTRLGLPQNIHQLYRNEAESLYLGLKSALCEAAPVKKEGE